MRHWLFLHVQLLATAVVFSVIAAVGAVVWAFPASFREASQRIDAWLAHFGFGTDSFLSQHLIGAVTVPLLICVMYRLLPRLVVFACKQLLPVNRDLAEAALGRIRAYHEQIWAEVLNRIDRDIQSSTKTTKSTLPRQFIPLEAEEIPTNHSRGRTSRIKSILSFLDAEFFLAPDSHVPLMMVEGEPGAGKSTVLFELFRQLRLRLERNKYGWIPVLIFADKLTEDMLLRPDGDGLVSFERFLENCNTARHPGAQQFLQMHRLDRSAQFAIIIDGLDEFSDTSRYTAFAAKLNSVLATASDRHRIVVSCRKEDNEGAIRARLICVKALTERQITQQLKRAAKKTGDQSPEEWRRALDGLRESRDRRLLRNYVSNPYLLKLIVDYYRGQDATFPLANALDKVFEQVLVRELLKHNPGPEGARDSSIAKGMAAFLRDLLGPYCYQKSLPRLSGTTADQEAARLAAHLRKNVDLAALLFGDEDRLGYLRLKYNNRSTEAEKISLDLVQRWKSKAQVDPLVDWIEANRTRYRTYEDFERGAIRHLYDSAFGLLAKAKLASIDGDQIHRMRHRRMQHYFMAAHVDRVGLSACPEFRDLLSNSWLREPLRILAAVGAHPEAVLHEFASRYDRVTVAAGTPALEAIENRCSILRNAAAFIAYLPAQQKDDRTGAQLTEKRIQVLLEQVSGLGLRVQTLYHMLYTRDVVDELSGVKGGPLMSRDACLEALADIYGSEFLSADCLKFKVSTIFDPPDDSGEEEKNSWRVLHRWHMRQSAYFQRLAYKTFYRIRSRHAHFPVRALSVFLYAIDGVLFSSNEYRTVIRDTHFGWKDRSPVTISRWCVNLASAALPVLPAAILWRAFGASLPGLALMTLFGAILIASAYVLQARHLLNKGDAYKVLPWFLCRLFKGLWARRGMRREYSIGMTAEPTKAEDTAAAAGDAAQSPPSYNGSNCQAREEALQALDVSPRSHRIAAMLTHTDPSALIDSLTARMPRPVARVEAGAPRRHSVARMAFALAVLFVAGLLGGRLGPSVEAFIVEIGLRSDVADARRSADDVDRRWRASGMRLEGEAFEQLRRAYQGAKANIDEVVARVNNNGPSNDAKRETLLAELKSAMTALPTDDELNRRQEQLTARSRLKIFKAESEDVTLQATVLLQGQPSAVEATLRDNHVRERTLAARIKTLLTGGRALNGASLGNDETANLNERLAGLAEISNRVDTRERASSQRLAEMEGTRAVSVYLGSSLPMEEKAAAMIAPPLLGLDPTALIERSAASDGLAKELQASVTQGELILGLPGARAGWPDVQSKIADLRQSLNGLQGLRVRIASRLGELKAADDARVLQGDWERLERDFRSTRTSQKGSVEERMRTFEDLLGRAQSVTKALLARTDIAGQTRWGSRFGVLSEMEKEAGRKLAALRRESARATLLEKATRLVDEAKRSASSEDDAQQLAQAAARANQLLEDLRSVEAGLKSLSDSQAGKLLPSIAESQRIANRQVERVKAKLVTTREQAQQNAGREAYAGRWRAIGESDALANLRKKAIEAAATENQRLDRLRRFQRDYPGDVNLAGIRALWHYSRLADPVEEDLVELATFSATLPALLASLKAFHRQAEDLASDPMGKQLEDGRAVTYLRDSLAAEIAALEQVETSLQGLPQEIIAQGARAAKEQLRQKLLGWVVAGVCIFIILVIVYAVRTRWSDRKGLHELNKINSERVSLISFLQNNPYSGHVVDTAITDLVATLPKTVPELKVARQEIAGLCGSLENRNGEMDIGTTRRVHQILREIDNTITHHSASDASAHSEPARSRERDGHRRPDEAGVHGR